MVVPPFQKITAGAPAVIFKKI